MTNEPGIAVPHHVAAKLEQLRRRVEELEAAASEHRQTEAALRASEAQLRRLFDNLSDFILIVDRQSRILFTNPVREEAANQQLRNSLGLDHIAPEHREACREALDHAFETGQVQHVVAKTVYGGWWNCTLVPILDGEDAPTTMIICDEITEQRQAEQSVKREQQLLTELLDLQERERRLFACEIHDGLAQQIAGAQMRLQTIRPLCEALAPPEAQQAYHEALALLEDSIHEARRLISGLRPPILDESGIVAAIEYLVSEANAREQSDIEFVHDLALGPLPPLLETAVFRIVQESLNNACRHSHSSRVSVSLRSIPGQIQLEVRDWGVGFVPAEVPVDRFGLHGIRERVRLLEGTVVIETAPGRGTLIRVDLPLREAFRSPGPPTGTTEGRESRPSGCPKSSGFTSPPPRGEG